MGGDGSGTPPLGLRFPPVPASRYCTPAIRRLEPPPSRHRARLPAGGVPPPAGGATPAIGGQPGPAPAQGHGLSAGRRATVPYPSARGDGGVGQQASLPRPLHDEPALFESRKG